MRSRRSTSVGRGYLPAPRDLARNTCGREQRSRLGNRASCPRGVAGGPNRCRGTGELKLKKERKEFAMYKLISIILAALPVILFLPGLFNALYMNLIDCS